MPLRKYWIVLLLHLTSQVHLTSAQQLTELKETHNARINSPSLTEDLVQQLKRKLPQNKCTQWLLNFLFKPTQAAQTELIVASYLPYQGKRIGLIQLDKHGASNIQNPKKRSLVHIMLPVTKDKVILKQLSFSPGDMVISQQLIDSHERLNACAYIKEAKITVQKREDCNDTVDIHITTKDRFPISFNLDLSVLSLCINHNNMLGWGHLLKNQFFYDEGLGYSITYRAANISNMGIAGDLQYLTARKKCVRRINVFRDFTHQTNYAGRVEISYTKNSKQRLLDGSTSPQPTHFAHHHQRIWLGTTLNVWPIKDRQYGRFFLTGKVAHKHFVERPEVAQNTNRYFHNYTLGLGGVGFSNERAYQDQLVYGIGDIENIPYGRKVNLIGGYQIGEFANRPYLRLDIAQGGRIQSLGHLYAAINAGGFWHRRTVEQGVVQLKIDYFTPLLRMGNQQIRQFIRLDYLAGYNMFTGELISTNLHKVSKNFRDPFPGGTKRLCLGLETVLFTRKHFAGCQVATLGFVDVVRLQDAQGKVHQRSFCKAFGIGFRCAHPLFTFSNVQVKVGYAPITQNMLFTISTMIAGASNDLNIGEPTTIPFRE